MDATKLSRRKWSHSNKRFWSWTVDDVKCVFFNGPAADATDAPQPWGLLCNLCGDYFFHFSVSWSTGGMKLTGENRSTRGKNLSQCHFVHQKSHMDWPGIEPGPPRLSHGTACSQLTDKRTLACYVSSTFQSRHSQVLHGQSISEIPLRTATKLRNDFVNIPIHCTDANVFCNSIKVTLEQAMKSQRGSTGTTLLIL
jgi:hypothetical protein